MRQVTICQSVGFLMKHSTLISGIKAIYLLDVSLSTSANISFQILYISIFFANGQDAEKDPSLKSQRGRVFYDDGLMDVEKIMKGQISGSYENEQATQSEQKTRGSLLVMGKGSFLFPSSKGTDSSTSFCK